MTNQLFKSNSPYLIQHKDNPVHWQMWNEESLQMSKQLNKPILVSVGYSTCHWCHVMAHECFEDQRIADIMNLYFINIKIDREERPDLDHFFMNAIQFLGVSGGWPLHCFLTPELKPFYGGTYFPPVSKYGRIAWPDLLISIHKAFDEKYIQIVDQSNKLYQAVKDNGIKQVQQVKNTEIVELNQVAQSILNLCDLDHGGFGYGQKFPNTMLLNFLIRSLSSNLNTDFTSFLDKSIRSLCLAGMFDHLGGGFFRYTVDRLWKIPHFEKMAYDHALILSLLSDYSRILQHDLYFYFIQRSLRFWEAELQGTNGLFYAALDADSEGKEGQYYVWTNLEIQSILKDTSSDFFSYSELVPLDHSQELVLNFTNLMKANNEQIMVFFKDHVNALQSLLHYRELRLKPHIDTKFILGWNALIVTKYAKLFLSTQDLKFRTKSTELVESILNNFRIQEDNYIFCRTTNIHGEKNGVAFLEDYAFLLEALLKVYEISGTKSYLDLTLSLLETIESLFDHHHGIFFFTNPFHTDSLSTYIDLTDSSIPNPNAVIAGVYYRLFLMLSKQDYHSKFSKMLSYAFSGMGDNYYAHASWLCLHPDILNNYIILKSKNPYLPKEIKSFFKNREVVYFYSDEIPDGAFVICTNQTCSEAMYTLEQTSTYLEQFL